MQRIVLLAWLFAAPFCSAQITITPNPHALSYIIYAGQPPRAVISAMTSEEKGKLQQVYSATLQANPALDAEGDTLSAQMNAYRKVLMAAMVKIDPKVEALLGASSGSSLTKEQRDDIHQAQSNAMQADPSLQSQWDDLTKKMTAHQQEVDAAMVKLDSTVAPILAKLSP